MTEAGHHVYIACIESTFSCGVVAQVTGTRGSKPCAHVFLIYPYFSLTRRRVLLGFFYFRLFFFHLARALWRTGMSHDAARLSWW